MKFVGNYDASLNQQKVKYIDRFVINFANIKQLSQFLKNRKNGNLLLNK